MNTRTTNPKLLKKALSFILLLSLVLATFVSCSSVLVGKYVQVYSDGTYDEDEYYEFKANGSRLTFDGWKKERFYPFRFPLSPPI